MRLSQAYGFARSWLIYRGPTWKRRRMRELYRRYVNSGDLCFDIGSHIGNRVTVFRELGARVVAVEPQPLFARYLRSRVADDAVEVVEAAVGRHSGRMVLHTDPRNPTVSTLCQEFKERVRSEPSWSRVRWSQEDEVELVTLADLIDRYGEIGRAHV